jgi:tetratricopeptide (TPR) repeat protein
MLIDELLGYAANLAEKIDKAYAKSFNYLEIAGFYLDYGNKTKCQEILADCLITIESLKHPEEKADRLAWLGRVYARVGDQVKANEAFSRAALLARACEPAETVRGFYKIVCEYLDAGMEENAKELTSQLIKAIAALPYDSDKALELVNVADIYAELGQTDRAQGTLDEALKISLRIEDNWFKVERLVDVAQSFQDIGSKDKTALAIQESIIAAGSTGEENQSYFLLKISDLLIAEGETARALEVISKAIGLVQRDESAYTRLKNTLLAAEKYYKVGKAEEAIQLTIQGLDSIQSIEEIEDKISGYCGVASLMVDMDQKQKGLEIAGQAFDLCTKVPDKKTRVYLLGSLALLYLQLGERKRTAQTVSEILKILSDSSLKTQGLGAIVMDLSAAGESVLAFQMVKAIRDPHIKSSAVANIAKSLIDSGQETTEIREIAKEIISSSA